MLRRRFWHTGWAIIGLALISVTAAFAAPPASPPEQDAPTPTPSVTPTIFRGPTATITPTLLPPPQGGGRVAVGELVVRFGPSQEWNAAGGLTYGSEVFPVARSVNGNWFAIEWLDDIGWVLGELIVWDPGFQLLALPTLLPPSTPVGGFPTLTPTDTENPEATQDEATPTRTLEPPTATAEPVVDAPTATESIETPPSPTPAPEIAEAGEGPPEEEAEEAQPPESPPEAAPAALTIPPDALRFGLIGVGGLIALAAVVSYSARFIGRRLELRRYRDGFVLQHCPVCQQGSLELDEHVKYVFGIARIQRSVRCDVCRSVLREIQPGSWRYTIDPYVNPDLAEIYNGQQFNDADLPGFIADAAIYPPAWRDASEEPDPEQAAQEVISELEERFLEERAALEAEEAARAAAEAAAEEAAQEEAEESGDEPSDEEED